jgi:hypothetical protein
MSDEQETQSTDVGGVCESVKDTLLCPHCGKKLSKWATPDDPFSNWTTEFLYICFNDFCSYFLQGWKTMTSQGRPGMSYRFAYDPDRDSCMPIPVANTQALRGWIVE